MFHLRLLGAIDLRDDTGGSVDAILAQPSRFALLAYLALRNGRLVRRDELLAVFWPDLDEARARNSLSQALHVLRKALGPTAIVSRGVDVGVDATIVRCDAAEVERLALEGGTADVASIYGGDLLPAFNLNGVPAFERWLDAERIRLRALAASHAWKASNSAAAGGDSATAIAQARWSVETDPDEGRLRELMKLLDRAGDRAAAMRAFAEFKRRHLDELEIEASPETLALVEQLRQRDETRASPPVRVPETRAPAELPVLPAPAPIAQRTPRRRWAAGAVACIALVAAGVLLTTRARAVHADASVVRVAVLPFRVFATSEYSYLAGGMMDALSLDLDGAGPVKTIDPHAVSAFLARRDTSDPVDLGIQVTKRLSADRFVLGSVMVTGGRTRVSASMYDASGHVVATGAADVARTSEVLAATDLLARELLAHELPSPAQGLTRLAAITSPSMSALRHYLEGERFYRDGHFDLAAEAFGAAVHEDTSFALGNYRLAATLDWGIHRWEGQTQYEFLARAQRHMSALARHDQLLIMALGDFWGQQPVRSAERYREVIRDHPDNVEAWEELGEVTFHRLVHWGHPISEARVPFEHALALDPGNVNAHIHLARLAALRNDNVACDSLVRRALALAPTHDAALELTTLAALGSSSASVRAHAFDGMHVQRGDAADRIDPVWLAGVRVATYREDPQAGLAIAQTLVGAGAPPASRLLGELLAAHMSAGLGRLADALRHLDAASRIDSADANQVRGDILWLGPFRSVAPTLPRLSAGSGVLEVIPPALSSSRIQKAFFDGFAGIQAGDSQQVHNALVLLSVPLRDPDEDAFRVAESVLVQAAWASRTDTTKALQLLDSPAVLRGDASSPGYPRGVERMLRADLLLGLHRYRDALAWYESLPEDLGYGMMYIAPRHLGMAKAYDGLGDQASAAREYAVVARVWADADQVLQPIVIEAKRRASAGR